MKKDPYSILRKIKRRARDVNKGIFRSREVITTDLGHGHTTYRLGGDPYDDPEDTREESEEKEVETISETDLNSEEESSQVVQITLNIPSTSLNTLNNLAIKSGHDLTILMKNAIALATIAYKVHENDKELAIISKDGKGGYTLETSISLTKTESNNDEN